MPKRKTITVAGVKLPINHKNRDYLPVKQTIIGSLDELHKLAYSAKNNLPSLMIGETGVGKTAFIRYLAMKTNNGFRRVNLNGQTTVDEFVGKMLLNKEGTYWQDGVLIDAMRKGYWLVLDEINAALPEILFVLHSLLDDDNYVVVTENDGEVVRPHKDFRLFATMNPSGKYTGTKELNKAFFSRFPIILQVDFPGQIQEEKIVIHYCPKAKKAAVKNLVKMGKELRLAYQKDEIDFLCSTRDLINCALMSQDIGMKDSLRLCILNRCSEEDKKAVNTVVSLYFGKTGDARRIVDFEAKYKIEKKARKKSLQEMFVFSKDLVDYSVHLSKLTSGEAQTKLPKMVRTAETWKTKVTKELDGL